MFCPNCGKECSSKFCPNCGTNLESIQQKISTETKSNDTYIEIKDPKGKWQTFFLCLFLGWLGLHRLYTKKYISAAVYLLMLVVVPWALPFCVIYDLITIITNSFFWDHKQMVARYQASEDKNKIDGWMVAMLILIPISLLLASQSDDLFRGTVEMFSILGIPTYGVLTLDSYRKGKPILFPLVFLILCLIPPIIIGNMRF